MSATRTHIPELQLQAGQKAIAAQQVSANFKNCTTIVEIGTPPDDPEAGNIKRGGSSSTTQAQPTGNNGLSLAQLSALTTTSSGYYRVYWHDPVHFEVHEVKTNITWTYNGSCISSPSGSLYNWWLTETGWTKKSSSTWMTNSADCKSTTTWADTVYENVPFCWPVINTTTYDDVRVSGFYNGNLSGGMTGTWNTRVGRGSCPSLHYHTELRAT